ncbi:MAG: NAD(P)/FAD-dependent oxidoreductase [Oligoflexales bacterium]|nr:NAD(P)/FAD-dependent oxidoreductase [Oligoflexales bacterium]
MNHHQQSYVLIGGGAAGYFAAINSAEANPSVRHILLEATHRPMTKIKLSGGGRCNVTHHCFDPKLLVQNYPRGSKELLGAFTRFQAKDTIAWFAERGVELKTEADGRMFPSTNKSETIIECFHQEVERLGVEVRKGAKVNQIHKNGDRFTVEIQNQEPIEADRILLATGSSEAGYKLATSLGHQIISPVPSLFTFNCTHPILTDLMGTAFKQVALRLDVPPHQKKWQQTGPLLITHWGLSGPAVLKLSAFAARELHEAQYKASLSVNWVAPLTEEEVMELCLSQKKENGKQNPKSSNVFPLTKKFFHRILEHCLSEKQDRVWADLSKEDLKHLVHTLTSTKVDIDGKGVFKEEFVSCGGVDLKEVDFKTMESKVCPGLFFAGELLNIDGITGGFNFQNAWTTAWIAAQKKF